MNTTAVVTVLACDIVDSTAMMSRLGDDAADALRRRLFTDWRHVVDRHGGVVVKTIGDAIMAVFSASALPAVATSLDLFEATESLSDVESVHLRVGIATGEAAHEDGDWFGTPVVEAFRLCSRAEPDEVLLTETTRKVIGSRGDYSFEPVGSLKLKGLPEAVPAYALMHGRAPTPQVRRSAPAGSGRGRARRWVAAAVALLVVAAGAVYAVTATRGTDDDASAIAGLRATDLGYEPKLRPRGCTDTEGAGDRTVHCFTLTVPQDRQHPEGPQVRLPVIQAPAARAQTVPSISFAGLTGAVTDTTDRATADQWSIGVRGEPGTRPRLSCPEADRDRRARLGMDSASARSQLHGALDRCMERLTADRIDLARFGPNDVADDARDLVLAAELGQVDVRAFGDAAIPTYALVRRSPDVVRALRLGSPSVEPIDNVQRAADAERAFTRMVLRCREATACNSTIPDLPARLQALRSSVAATARSVETTTSDGSSVTVLVDADRLQSALWRGLHDDSVYGFIPTVIDQQAFDLIAAYLAILQLDQQLTEPTIREIIWECQRARADDTVGVPVVERQYPQWSTLAIPEVVQQCRRHRIEGQPALRAPVISDAPALVSYGEYEPEARQIAGLAQYFTSAQLVPLRGRAWADRNAWPECVVAVRRAFMRDPNGKVDGQRCGATAEPVVLATAPPDSFP